jgi:hypothetical protein
MKEWEVSCLCPCSAGICTVAYVRRYTSFLWCTHHLPLLTIVTLFFILHLLSMFNLGVLLPMLRCWRYCPVCGPRLLLHLLCNPRFLPLYPSLLPVSGTHHLPPHTTCTHHVHAPLAHAQSTPSQQLSPPLLFPFSPPSPQQWGPCSPGAEIDKKPWWQRLKLF